MNIGIHKYAPSLYAWLTVWWQKSICLFKKGSLGDRRMQSCNGLLSWVSFVWWQTELELTTESYTHELKWFMCCDFFPHLALQNCTCKTVHLCHSCSQLNCMFPWYLQALTVPCLSPSIYVLWYPIANQAPCCLHQCTGVPKYQTMSNWEPHWEYFSFHVPQWSIWKKRWECKSEHISLPDWQYQRIEIEIVFIHIQTLLFCMSLDVYFHFSPTPLVLWGLVCFH